MPLSLENRCRNNFHPGSTEPREVSAARVCAEGYRLYEQKHYAEAEARFLAGILESEKTVKRTSMRGGCLVQLARTQEKEGKYVDAEANARRAVAILERFPLSGNFGLSALIVLGDTLEDLAANPRSAWYIGTAFLLFVSWEQPEEH